MTTARFDAEPGDPVGREEAVAFLNRLVPLPAPSLEELLTPDHLVDRADIYSLRVASAVTVVVPTRNEEGNIAVLVERLAVALQGQNARILFVDDSDDATPLEVTRVAALSHIPVDLVHREPGARYGGLGGAVLEGLRATRSPWAVVMDGDLQHPPELVPELVAAGMRRHAEVVVASRRVPGGSASGLATLSARSSRAARRC